MLFIVNHYNGILDGVKDKSYTQNAFERDSVMEEKHIFSHKIIVKIQSCRDNFNPDNKKHRTNYWDEENEDIFYYEDGSIIVVADRTQEHETSDFYSIKSTFQFSTLKALIYYWLRFGPFRIKSIKLEFNDSTDIDVKKIAQNFTGNPNLKNADQKAKRILEINNKKSNHNNFITALSYQMMAISLGNKSLANAWQCFNHIYNVVYSNYIPKSNKEIIEKSLESLSSIEAGKDSNPLQSVNKIKKALNNYKSNSYYPDRDGIKHIWKEIKKDEGLTDCYLKAKNFFDSLSKSRIIHWVDEESNNKGSFKDKSGYREYSDTDLKLRLDSAMEERFDGKQENKASDVKKERNNSDYLLCVILYAYHLRNKFFHGQYRNSEILIKGEKVSEEKTNIANIIITLNWYLLDKYFNLLLN